MARVMAVRGSRLQRNLTSEQVMEMLSRLCECENYSFTPSGKAIMTELTTEELKTKLN
jgi:DNA mismatch repair protein MutL